MITPYILWGYYLYEIMKKENGINTAGVLALVSKREKSLRYNNTVKENIYSKKSVVLVLTSSHSSQIVSPILDGLECHINSAICL